MLLMSRITLGTNLMLSCPQSGAKEGNIYTRPEEARPFHFILGFFFLISSSLPALPHLSFPKRALNKIKTRDTTERDKLSLFMCNTGCFSLCSRPPQPSCILIVFLQWPSLHARATICVWCDKSRYGQWHASKCMLVEFEFME